MTQAAPGCRLRVSSDGQSFLSFKIENPQEHRFFRFSGKYVSQFYATKTGFDSKKSRLEAGKLKKITHSSRGWVSKIVSPRLFRLKFNLFCGLCMRVINTNTKLHALK